MIKESQAKTSENKKAKVFLLGRELHLPEGCTCTFVAWNLETFEVTQMIEGVTMVGKKKERLGEPYITFTSLVEDKDRNIYEVANPLEGGLEPQFAEQIARESHLAIAYLKAEGAMT
jgi:hypothetical protein